MNKKTPRSREAFSKNDGFQGNPLLRKASNHCLTKRRDGSGPGRFGIKSPPPQVVLVDRVIKSSKYMPHQGKRECSRRMGAV